MVWTVVVVYAIAMVTLPSLAIARGGAPRAGIATFAILASAMVGSGFVAAQGLYQHRSDSSPVWVGIPMFTLFVILMGGSRLPSIRRALMHPATPATLAWAQAFRLGGFVFVTSIFTGELAWTFGWPAGVGDIIVGVWALALVLSGSSSRRSYVAFNVFGLLDLAVAIFFGVTSLRGLFHVWPVDPSTAALTVLPLALIPSVGVPIMATMHFVALRQLRVSRGKP